MEKYNKIFFILFLLWLWTLEILNYYAIYFTFNFSHFYFSESAVTALSTKMWKFQLRLESLRERGGDVKIRDTEHVYSLNEKGWAQSGGWSLLAVPSGDTGNWDLEAA